MAILFKSGIVGPGFIGLRGFVLILSLKTMVLLLVQILIINIVIAKNLTFTH